MSSLIGLVLVVSGFYLTQGLVSFPVSCAAETTLFSNLPVALSDIVDLGPLGQMTPPDHVLPAPHNYVYVIDYQNPSDKEAMVYASSDMVLRHIGLRHYNSMGQYTDYTDYTLVFSVCSEFDLYFHHVRSLRRTAIKNAAMGVQASCNFSTTRNEDYCSGNVSIPVKAGELVGTTGDLKGGVYGLDIGARDYRQTSGRTNFANPDRYCNSFERNSFSRCYTVCAFDYFPDDIRTQLRFTGKSGRVVRDEPPACGGVHYDVSGTAQCNWYRVGAEESGGPEANFLFLGPDNLDPSTLVFSVGTAIPTLAPGMYQFQASGSINADFRTVIPDDQIRCYEPVGQMSGATKVTLVQLLDSVTLRIEGTQAASCASSPWTFTQNFTDFQR